MWQGSGLGHRLKRGKYDEIDKKRGNLQVTETSETKEQINYFKNLF